MLCLLVCENLEREVSSIVESERFDDVVVRTFEAHCDRPPAVRDALSRAIRACEQDGNQIHVLGGACLASMQALPDEMEQCRLHKLDGCFNLFVGNNAVAGYLQSGAYLLTPGWLARWRSCVSEWGFDLETALGTTTARKFFVESATRLTLLDTGVDATSAERLAEFANFVGLPFEIAPVGLDFARLFLTRIVLEWRLENERGQSARGAALTSTNRRLADDAMVFDLIGHLPRATTEAQAIENILDLFAMLCAPAGLIYIPIVGGQPGKARSRPDSRLVIEAKTRLAAFDRDYAWTDSGNGFVLRISHQDETLGVLEVEGVTFPEYKQHYLNLALTVVQVCGLAIANARSYQKQQSLIEELEEALAQRKQAEGEIRNIAKFPAENPSPILRLSSEGIILYANDASQTVLQEWGCGVGEPAPEFWRKRVAQVLASELSQIVDVSCVGYNANEQVFSFVVVPIMAAGYVNLYGQDITERKQMELALRESEQKLTTLFELLPVGVSVLDADNQVAYMNPALTEILDVSQEGLLRGNHRKRTYLRSDGTPMSADEFASVRAAREQSAVYNVETGVVKEDDQVVWVNVSAVPVAFSDWRVVIVTADITERKRAEQALQRRNRDLALLNQVSQALVATLDIHEITASLTQAIAEAVGAEGSSVWLQDDRCPGGLVCRGAAYPGQKRSLINLYLEPGEGITGWVAQTGECAIVLQASNDPRFSPRIDDLIGFHTASVLAVPMRFQEKLIGVLEAVNKQNGDFDAHDCNLIETLANSAAIGIENARLVEALRQQTTELQARNQELDTFAHTVAHDLKTPLSLIIGYADLFADQPEASLNEMRHSLQIIARNGCKMSSIIDELLLLSEARSVQVPLEPIHMASVLAEVQERFALDIRERQAEIIVERPDASAWPVVWGYAPWIEEVWANYISNAIKYGGTPPRVELGATPLPDGQVRFWVRDNGRGLSPDDQARLFTPFARLGQARAKGHGLGLSIVRRIVEKLGGQVGVESQPGQGSTFSFTLPGAPG